MESYHFMRTPLPFSTKGKQFEDDKTALLQLKVKMFKSTRNIESNNSILISTDSTVFAKNLLTSPECLPLKFNFILIQQLLLQFQVEEAKSQDEIQFIEQSIQ